MIEYMKFEDSERIGNLELDFRNENQEVCIQLYLQGKMEAGKH